MLLLGYSILYKEYYLTKFNHLMRTSSCKTQQKHFNCGALKALALSQPPDTDHDAIKMGMTN